MSQNGKGSGRRPRSVDYKIWEKNYENIFRKNQKNSRPPVDRPITDDRMKENQSRD